MPRQYIEILSFLLDQLTGLTTHAPTAPEPAIAECVRQLPAPRHLVWAFVRPPARLDDEGLLTLARVQQDAAMRQVYQLVQQFQHMMRLRDTRELSDWFRQCAESEVSELVTFAAGLQREEAALRLALTEKWSTGTVEDQVTRIKCVKRQMYGRASFDMLRRRVLRAI